MDFVIEEFRPEYKKQVVDLILKIQKEEFQIDISIDDQPDLMIIHDYYQKKNGNFWVAMLDNKVVGTIALLDIGNSQSALRKMFVSKEFRGRDIGVGKRLIDNLFAFARDKKFIDIFLGTTDKYLAAHRFYEKNGFSRLKKEDLPNSFPIVGVDTIFYQLDLEVR